MNLPIIGKKPEIILHLTRDAITIYSPGSAETDKIVLENTVVKHLEVLRPDELIANIQQFLIYKNIKTLDAVLVLGSDVCFIKEFKENEDIDNEIQQFIDEMPFDPTTIAWLKVPKEEEKKINVVATNQNLYSCIFEGFTKGGWDILAIVPEFVFGVGAMSQTKVAEIMTNRDLWELADFSKLVKLTPKEKKKKRKKKVRKNKEETSKEQEPKTNKRLFVFLGIFAALALVLAGLLYRNYMYTPPVEIFEETGETAPSPVEEPVIEEIEEEVEIVRDDVRITVLNGTGVAGLAGDTKARLEALGYSRIEVGNSDESNFETIIFHNPEVQEEILEEVLDDLYEIFADVITEEFDEPNEAIDIQVVTGALTETELDSAGEISEN